MAVQTNSIPRRRWMRVIPIAFIMYTLAFVDRVNISFAIPGLEKDLGISPTMAGLAGGIFFFGYMFLQMPGGHWATVWSARKFVTIALIGWGICAMLSGLVHNAVELCIIRFLLGLAEGGVWPATLILLSRWFPLEERARANSYWLFCIPVASIVMSPVSGWLLTWADWRMLLVLEGLPPLTWALVWWLLMSDSPEQARWLAPEEKAYLAHKLSEEQKQQNILPDSRGNWRETIRDRRVWQLVLAHFLTLFGIYSINLWLPVMIMRMTGLNAGLTGLLATLPYLAALVGLYFNASHSDRTGERKKHIAIPYIVASAALLLSALVGDASSEVGMLSLIIAEGFLLSTIGVFWTLPPLFLKKANVGTGIGFINALGNLGGFVGLLVVGYCFSLTRSSLPGILAISGALVAASITILLLREPVQTSRVPVEAFSETMRSTSDA